MDAKLAAATHRLMFPRPGDDRAELRREVCLARGVLPDDIDPGTGHEISRRAYEQVRREWRDLAAGRPLEGHALRGYQAARAYWQQRLPEWTDGDDWLADTTN